MASRMPAKDLCDIHLPHNTAFSFSLISVLWYTFTNIYWEKGFAVQFTRISHDIHIMGGKACVKGTRVTVSMIVNQVSEGRTVEQLLEDYPYLTHDDIVQALKYAAWTVDAKEIEIVSA